MISLHVYLSPKSGMEKEFESAVRDKWLAAMAEQPGFLSGALLTPFPDAQLKELEASKPQSQYEAVAFWRSEDERLRWVARPIHDQVFSQVLDASEGVSYTLQTAEQSWGM